MFSIKFNKILNLKYLTAAVLLAIPLYPKFPFLRIPGTYVSIRLEDFLMLLVIIVLSKKYINKIKNLWLDPVVRSVLIFLCVGPISLLSAIFITHSVSLHIGILHWARRIEYFTPLLLGMAVLEKQKLSKGRIEFFIKVISLVILILFIYGFGQKYFSWPVIITQNEEFSKGIALRWVPGSHINSSFAGHYDLASFLTLTLPIFITLFFLQKDLKIQTFLFVVIISGLWLLTNSVSRISIITYLTGTSLSLFLVKKYKALLIMFIFSLVLFSFSSDLQARYRRVIEVVIKDISAKEGVVVWPPTPTPQPVFEDRSTSIRLNVEWPRAIRAFLKNPLLGTGYSSITLATDNDYLRLLGEVGILGFASFILILANIEKLFLKVVNKLNQDHNHYQLAFLAGLIGSFQAIFVQAFFIDVFEASKFAILFWLLLGMGISLTRNMQNE